MCHGRDLQFLTLNFRFGAYHFHKWQNVRCSRASLFSPFRRPSFSKFLSVQAVTTYSNTLYTGSSPPAVKQSASQMSIHGQRMRIFTTSSSRDPTIPTKSVPECSILVPETPIFTLELVPEPPLFTLRWHMPPPPPGGGGGSTAYIFCQQIGIVAVLFFSLDFFG